MKETIFDAPHITSIELLYTIAESLCKRYLFIDVYTHIPPLRSEWR